MHGARWLLPIAAIGGVVIGILGAERFERTGGRGWLGLGWQSVGLRIVARRAPALLIQCKAIAERPAQTIMRFGAAIALALGADRLMAIFQFDGRALLTAILAMAATSLLLAGFYRMLVDARSAMAGYLAALPLPPHYWPVRDTKFVLLLNGVPLVILLWPQIVGGLLSLLIVFGLAVANQVLLVLPRWPVIHGGQRSLIYSVLLTAIWSGAAIAAVPQWAMMRSSPGKGSVPLMRGARSSIPWTAHFQRGSMPCEGQMGSESRPCCVYSPGRNPRRQAEYGSTGSTSCRRGKVRRGDCRTCRTRVRFTRS
jgi:hypothetical protein